MKSCNSIQYHTCKFDNPIVIANPNLLKLTLAMMLEMKADSWRFADRNELLTEDGGKVTYSLIREILDIPNHKICKIKRNMYESRNAGVTGGKTAKEKTLCKLNRLVEIAYDMQNDCFLREMERHCFEPDFAQEMKNAGVDIDDETQMDEYCMRNRNALKKRYGIVELQDWYKERFPECGRQTMKRDFDVLNDVGCRIQYDQKAGEYRVENPWQQ